jgi:hypothetical protein
MVARHRTTTAYGMDAAVASARMSDTVAADRKATWREVRQQAAAIRRLAAEFGLAAPRIRDDGTVVIHSTDPGYHTANRFSAASTRAVGAYVHVITDDVPGAASAQDL